MDVAFSLPTPRSIEEITFGNPTLVRTHEDHGYTNDLYVRLVVPYNFLSDYLDRKVFSIKVVSARSFYIPVDTSSEISMLEKLKKTYAIPIAQVEGASIQASMQNEDLSPRFLHHSSQP